MYNVIFECQGFFTRKREVSAIPLIGDSVIIEDLCTDAHPDVRDYSRNEVSEWMTLEGVALKRKFSFVGSDELVYIEIEGRTQSGGTLG